VPGAGLSALPGFQHCQRKVDEAAPQAVLLLQPASSLRKVCDQASVFQLVDRRTWISAPADLPLGACLFAAPLNVLHLARVP
jgi:hypothetical protein